MLDRVTRRLEQSPVLGVGIGVFMFVIVVWLQSSRPLWYDEIITLYVCRLPDLATIWKAMGEGVDYNPPFFYLATRTAVWLFGESANVLRLPGMVGYFGLCASVFTVVARRLGDGYGLAAGLLPLGLGSVYYATEARAYGLMLGCTGLAVVAWDFARAGVRPRLNLAAMSLFLTGALLTHCYAVLVLFPFGLVWLVRVCRKKPQPAMAYLAAILLPLLAVATYLPLLAAIRPFAVENELFQARWTSIIEFYHFVLDPAWLLAFTWIAVAQMYGNDRKLRFEERPEDTDLWVLGTGFLLVPVLAILLAASYTHILMSRYALAAIIGVSILLPLATVRLVGGDRRLGAALGLGVISILLINSGFRIYHRWEPAKERSTSLQSRRADLPMVLGSGLLYLEMDREEPAANLARMTYVLDEQAARTYTGSDIFDKSFPVMKRWFPLRMRLETYQDFTQRQSRFLMLEIKGHGLNWLSKKIRADGGRVQLVETSGRLALYEVDALPH